MIRIELQVALRYEIDQHGADFVFNVHAAHTDSQTVRSESLQLNSRAAWTMHTEPTTGNRCLYLRVGPGKLTLRYAATVDLQHHRSVPSALPEVPVSRLPFEVLAYIYPSRYCPSDRLVRFATHEFGDLPKGCGRVLAIQEWVHRRVRFTPGSSNASTSAIETLIEQIGVCRDFAHLMIALCRALSIPARFVTGTDYGADPALGPPDFHAYVEVYLGDRWYIFDPSGTSIPMGFVRVGTGRDAADVAFATIFGGVKAHPPVISGEAVVDRAIGAERPEPCADMLSTDGGERLALCPP